eukprot:5685063-Amphidinium_carterae.1
MTSLACAMAYADKLVRAALAPRESIGACKPQKQCLMDTSSLHLTAKLRIRVLFIRNRGSSSPQGFKRHVQKLVPKVLKNKRVGGISVGTLGPWDWGGVGVDPRFVNSDGRTERYCLKQHNHDLAPLDLGLCTVRKYGSNVCTQTTRPRCPVPAQIQNL